MTKSTRRAVLALGAAAASIALLAGCAGGPAPSTERPEKVDFTVALWGGADRAKIYQEVLDKWTAGQEGVTAVLEFADIAPYFERLSANAAARKLPDVFWLNDTNFPRYATNELLLDLTPFLGKQIVTDELKENWLPYGQVNDGTYGITSHFNGQAVVTDQRIFDAQNETYDAKTWDEVFTIARRMTRPNEQVWGLEDTTLGPTQRAFEVWVRQHGQELYTADGKLAFDKELLVEWWKMWAALRADQVIPPPDVQIESEAQGTATGLLTHGKVAIRLSSATHLAAYGSQRDHGLSIHDYPEIPNVSEDWRFYTALIVAANAGTPAPELAAELINVLVNDKESAAITKISMGTPTPTSVAEAILPDLKEHDQKVVGYLTRQLENPSRPSPMLPEANSQVIGALQRMGQEVAYGTKTPEAAADQFFTDAEQYLG